MADWGVFYRKVEIFPHSNADSLEIARAGNYQFVVRKGEYKEGDGALVIPEKSILSGELKDKYQAYLVGADKSRVGSVKLRGELSMGILMSPEEASSYIDSEPVEDFDYSEAFGVKKYEPPVPTQLAGSVEPLPNGSFSKHDAEHLSVYRDALLPEDDVVVTEKIHGCLHRLTKITMSDGTKKPIYKVVVGDEVFGVDASGALVSTPVTRIFNNGKSDTWMRITPDRKTSFRGGQNAGVVCTPNHRFWSPTKEEYVSASQLSVGDSILLSREDITLTYLQREVLKGKLLGFEAKVAEITDVTDTSPPSSKLDIETGTHNFFANGVLVHNSQAVYTLTDSGEFFVSSKGLFSKGLRIKDSETNAYWRAARAVGMEDRLKLLQHENDGATVQAFGEIVPVQGGNWTYGLKDIDVLIFDVRVSGQSYSFDGSIPAYFMELWVPILYIGKFGQLDVASISKGMEQVSGKQLHIREGVVIRPLEMKFAKDGTRLFLKSINPKYKQTGEEIN